MKCERKKAEGLNIHDECDFENIRVHVDKGQSENKNENSWDREYSHRRHISYKTSSVVLSCFKFKMKNQNKNNQSNGC